MDSAFLFTVDCTAINGSAIVNEVCIVDKEIAATVDCTAILIIGNACRFAFFIKLIVLEKIIFTGDCQVITCIYCTTLKRKIGCELT